MPPGIVLTTDYLPLQSNASVLLKSIPIPAIVQTKLVLAAPATAQIWLFRRDGGLVEHRQLAGADFYVESYTWTDLPPGVYTALAQSGEDWVYSEFRNPVGATLAVALFAINEFGNQKYAIIESDYETGI